MAARDWLLPFALIRRPARLDPEKTPKPIGSLSQSSHSCLVPGGPLAPQRAGLLLSQAQRFACGGPISLAKSSALRLLMAPMHIV